MSYIITALILLIIVFILYALSTRCRKGQPGMRKFHPWAYAHRGLHNQARPENSLSAFRAAITHGYGIELDVHLLKDGHLAVIHDSLLKRTTGAQGRIEDLHSHDLWHYHLEGSSEHIPTLQEVLNITEGAVPLLVELKTHKGNYPALCEAVCREMDRYQGLYCIQSFDFRAVRWFRKNRPDVIRGQLYHSKSRLPGILRPMLPWQALNCRSLPDFISCEFAHRKTLGNLLIKKLWGASRFCWVIASREDYRTAKKEGWICIFEGFEP